MSATRTAFSEAAHRAAVAFGVSQPNTMTRRLEVMTERRDMFAEHLGTMPVKYLGETWVITCAGTFLEFVQQHQHSKAVSVGLDEARRLDEFAARAYAKPIPAAKAISLGDALRSEVSRLTVLIDELATLLAK